MFVALIMAIYSFGLANFTSLLNFIESIYNNWQAGILFTAAFIIGAWLIYPFFSFRDKLGSTIIKKTELGEVDITLRALENLVQGITKQQEQIAEIETSLKSDEEGLKIFLKGKVHQGTIIPELSRELQDIVKSYIEKTTGVNVVEVKVLIEDIYEHETARVE